MFARKLHGMLNTRQLTEYAGALAITAVCTAIAFPLYPHVDSINIVMIYLLGTTLGALRLNRGACVVLPVANILAFDYFFVPPTFSFDVADTQYIFTMVAMLVVALVIAHLMVSIRRNRDVTDARERRTAVLYDMSRELAVATSPQAMVAAAVRHIGAVFQSTAVVLLADEQEHLTPVVPFPESAEEALPVLATYDLAFAHEVAARGARSNKDAIYLPLQGSRRVKGVIVVRPRYPLRDLPTEQLNLLDAFAAQLAMSLQRARIAEAAEVARIAAERALLRNTLLASISHDLRTPLAAIAGAGTGSHEVRRVTEAMHVILIIEDDAALQNILRMLFEANGFRVVVAGTAARGELDSRLHRPDIVLVDLGLPDSDGLNVIIGIRAWSPVPIIVLSARTAEAQRLAAFDQGADDYVMKPFSAPELLARVRAMVRRHVRGELPMAVLQLGDVSVDLSRRVVSSRDGREVRLTPLEHRILETLARHGERIVTYAALIKEVWGPERDDSRALRVYIGSLRRKLEVEPSRPRHILTELGVGYRLVMDLDATAARFHQPPPKA